MLVSHFKIYIFRELKTKVIILTVLTILLGLIYVLKNKVAEQENSAKNISQGLSKQLENIRKDISEAQKAQKGWDAGVNLRFKNRSGIRIKDANNILEELKKVFKLKNVSVSLTNPEKKNDGIQSNFSKIVYSFGNISFDNNTDIETLKFIDTVIKDIPGFIQVKSLDMSRPKIGAAKLMNDIEFGRLDNGIIKVKMEFIWLDVQDLNSTPDKVQLSPNNTKPTPSDEQKLATTSASSGIISEYMAPINPEENIPNSSEPPLSTPLEAILPEGNL